MKSRKRFLQFVQFIIQRLSVFDDKYVVISAYSWFPIFNENNCKENSKWIIEMVSKMSTKCKFDFGIYLTDYIAYIMKPEAEFDQIYLDFLKKYLGITWKITPKTEQSDNNDTS